jgi:DNA helicase IV
VAALKRVAVGGGAGAGKTIVALEDAARLNAERLRTLVTCVSPDLAAELASRLNGTGVVVRDFADLCGFASAEDFSDEHGPQMLMDRMASEPDLQFDAVVVDEAQDFRSHWWIAIESALRSPTSGRIHAYYDTNQSVYGDLTGELAGFQMAPIRLTRNLRNTKAIHQASSRFYQGLPVTADGPEGSEVRWMSTGRDVEDDVKAEVRRLVLHEELKPDEMAVIAAEGGAVDRLREGLQQLVTKGLTVTTIAAFKGLERPAVVIVADAHIVDRNELAYVALSRARSHLTVMGSQAVLEWLKSPG